MGTYTKKHGIAATGTTHRENIMCSNITWRWKK
jgi:hypothetical protein